MCVERARCSHKELIFNDVDRGNHRYHKSKVTCMRLQVNETVVDNSSPLQKNQYALMLYDVEHASFVRSSVLSRQVTTSANLASITTSLLQVADDDVGIQARNLKMWLEACREHGLSVNTPSRPLRVSVRLDSLASCPIDRIAKRDVDNGEEGDAESDEEKPFADEESLTTSTIDASTTTTTASVDTVEQSDEVPKDQDEMSTANESSPASAAEQSEPQPTSPPQAQDEQQEKQPEEQQPLASGPIEAVGFRRKAKRF